MFILSLMSIDLFYTSWNTFSRPHMKMFILKTFQEKYLLCHKLDDCPDEDFHWHQHSNKVFCLEHQKDILLADLGCQGILL